MESVKIMIGFWCVILDGYCIILLYKDA